MMRNNVVFEDTDSSGDEKEEEVNLDLQSDSGPENQHEVPENEARGAACVVGMVRPDAEVLPQQLPHKHLVEPCLQLLGTECADISALLLQLANYLAPLLSQEPLQEVLHGTKYKRRVTGSARLAPCQG